MPTTVKKSSKPAKTKTKPKTKSAAISKDHSRKHHAAPQRVPIAKVKLPPHLDPDQRLRDDAPPIGANPAYDNALKAGLTGTTTRVKWDTAAAQEIERLIEALSTVAESRRAKCKDRNLRGLKPSTLDWMSDLERSAQTRLTARIIPRSAQEAQAAVRSKRAARKAAREEEADDLVVPPEIRDDRKSTALVKTETAMCQCGHLETAHAADGCMELDTKHKVCQCEKFRPVLADMTVSARLPQELPAVDYDLAMTAQEVRDALLPFTRLPLQPVIASVNWPDIPRRTLPSC